MDKTKQITHQWCSSASSLIEGNEGGIYPRQLRRQVGRGDLRWVTHCYQSAKWVQIHLLAAFALQVLWDGHFPQHRRSSQVTYRHINEAHWWRYYHDFSTAAFRLKSTYSFLLYIRIIHANVLRILRFNQKGWSMKPERGPAMFENS